MHLACLPLPLPADCDVYFRQPIRLIDWGTPLPEAVGMA